MNGQLVASFAFFALGILAFLLALYHERRMQRHRQPGVSYRAVTLRRDGGWRRAELFTAAGLHHQKQASRYGLVGAALWLVSLGSWIASASG